MKVHPVSQQHIAPKQLSLDLGEAESNQRIGQKAIDRTGIERSVVFPKNIKIYGVADFQRRVSQLFAPLNIQIDFRVTRQNRVVMRWSFPQEAVHYQRQDGARAELLLSAQENEALKRWFYPLPGQGINAHRKSQI